MPESKRLRSKRFLGMVVVALILLTLLAIGYFYTADSLPEQGAVAVAVRGYLSEEQRDLLTARLAAYSPDQEIPITLQVYEFPVAESDEDDMETVSLLRSLLEGIETGRIGLMLLDDYAFEMLADDRLFEDLSVRYPNDPAVARKYLYPASVMAASGAGDPAVDLPEVYFALRSPELAGMNKNPKYSEKYSLQSELLDNVAAAN